MLTTRFSLRAVALTAMVPLCGCHGPDARPAIQPASVNTPALIPPSDPLHPWVRMETSLGDIIFELDAAEAPTVVINFVEYAEGGEYDGTIFHRVVPDRILQGGGYTPDLEPKPRTVPQVVPDNWHIELQSNEGTLALIRPSDQLGKTTAEFFINLTDNVRHDMGRNHGRYAVFGRVVAGHDTVNRIRSTPIGPDARYGSGLLPVVPVEPVVITSVRLLSEFDASAAREVIAIRYPTPANAVRKLFGKKVADALTETGSGLSYADIKVGRGPRSPEPDQEIEFQYRGTFLNGEEFESSYERLKPLIRKMNSMIPGLQEAFSTMTEGGHRVIVVPPELAYKEGGIPGIIPPSSILIYELELLVIQ
ncbi:MAG: peptidylprolyl isomerase [Planctomycetes bacterium]|nr:peptidylprolyl isomerase [Planctomycetota bacterium]